ncbi:MAG: hypothetical protein JWR16_3316 [Nevskia sp.]|nr:hypothetical protein [Nevskia sp.]
MNKKLCVMLLLACSLPAWADHDEDDKHLNNYTLTFASPSSRRIDVMTSQIHEASGSAADIINRAQDCVARYVSNEPATSNGVLGIGAKGRHSASSDATQPVLESADPDSGVLMAHSRAPYHHLLLSFEARSRLSVEAKDGRFKIVQNDLAYRQLDTGNDASQDFSPIQRLAVTGWDGALEALQEVSDNVAECVEGK